MLGAPDNVADTVQVTGDGRHVTADAALHLAIDLFRAYGVPPAQAQVVASHLVDAEQCGISSHGLLRVPQYIEEIGQGQIVPDAVPECRRTGHSRADIEARRCLGQVAGSMAVDQAIELAAETGLGLVTVRQCAHAGRIGAYAEQLGHAGLLSVIFCSGPRSGHRVAPFNGREARLATNPIAFSIPTSGMPIVGDFSTGAAPEGRIRAWRDLGKHAPEGTLLDARGQATTDPHALYADPPGVILPFGGQLHGHRGFALGLLVEAMATLLTGDETADDSRVGNNLAIIAVSVPADYRDRANRMAVYVRSARPIGGSPTTMPGNPEQMRRSASTTITIPESTWHAIARLAASAGVDLARRTEGSGVQ
jgi:hydroxycarboxylate dehydrogenase B